MTGRAAAVQGGLAALGLLVANFTWQREPERAPGAVTIIDATKSDLAKVRYEDDASEVDITPNKGGGEAKVWLHLVSKAKTPDPKAPTKTPPPKPAPPRDLAGGENAGKLFDSFAPMISPRAFGSLDAAKLKELGLEAPKRKLEVTVKGEVRRYEIGQPANATGGESFIRDTRDGRVYLMPRTMLTDLQNAPHLVDRRLHTFEPLEFDRIVVSSGGKQKELLQVGRESRTTAGFASSKTPDKRDQMAKNWHDAIWRTFPSDILGRGEEPSGGKPAPAVRVDYYEGKKAVGWLELAKLEPKVDSTTGISGDDTSPPAAQPEVYARTEHTAGWAKLHSASSLITDAQKLVAAP